MSDILTNKALGPYVVGNLVAEKRYTTRYLVQGANAHALEILTTALAQDIMYPSRFRQQMERVTQLEHPHLLPVHNYGTDDGYSYVVLPNWSGRAFEQLTDVDAVLELLQQIAGVLGYIHSQGLVHGDLCLEQVVFDEGGNAYLGGVGLAVFVHDTLSLIGDVAFMTDPAYTAPEQWQGETATPYTDIYALGVLAYRLLTGRVPFEASTQGAVQYQHLNEMPIPIHIQRPDIPPTADSIIQQAIAKQPHERYPSAPAFVKALLTAIQGETATEDDTVAQDDHAMAPAYQHRPKTVGWWLRRAGCGLMLGTWVMLMLSPCVFITVLAQGEFVVNFSDRPGHEIRLFEIQNEQARGFGLSWGGVKNKANDGFCIATHVKYWMWEGKAENTDYCQCYTTGYAVDDSRQCEP